MKFANFVELIFYCSHKLWLQNSLLFFLFQEMLYVVPFVAKIIESSAKSKVFKPPNPWVMAIMAVLVELHQVPDLKVSDRTFRQCFSDLLRGSLPSLSEGSANLAVLGLSLILATSWIVYTIMFKSLGTNFHMRVSFFFSNQTWPAPTQPNKQHWHLCLVFFPVSALNRVGDEEELQDIFGKVALFYECIQKLQHIIITASLSWRLLCSILKSCTF